MNDGPEKQMPSAMDASVPAGQKKPEVRGKPWKIVALVTCAALIALVAAAAFRPRADATRPLWSRLQPRDAVSSKSSGGSAGSPVPTVRGGELTDFNVALDANGGAIESITGTVDPSFPFYGPGLFGRRLIDGKAEPAWAGDPVNEPKGVSHPDVKPTVPLEIVFSFYRHQPALVGAVVVTSSSQNPNLAPKEVEVWTSNTSPSEGFQKVGSGTLPAEAGAHRITFDAIEARYLKVRVLSNFQDPSDLGDQKPTLEIAEIEVLEARRSGYVSLRERSPDLPNWKGSPRYAAQRGVEWMQPASVAWQKGNDCFGCHIQAQVAMGLAVAKKNGYIVDDRATSELIKFTEAHQQQDGSYERENEGSTAFAGMGLAYWDDLQGIKRNPVLLKAADFLLTKQDPSGEVPYMRNTDDPNALSVLQGSLTPTANSLTTFKRAYDETNDSRYKAAADRALAWIAAAPIATTQDKVFKILALARFGGGQYRGVIQQVVEQLIAEQDSGGGWPTGEPDVTGANPFSTGQVLYAFKQAGVSVQSSPFVKGVKYLLAGQTEAGSWEADDKAMKTQGAPYAPTMWATIGLAGAFADVKTETLQIQTEEKGCTRELTVGSDALFAFNQATLTPAAQQTLAVLGPEIQKAGQHPVQVKGYTDAIGSDSYNQILSEQRARAVRDWLVTHQYVAAGTPIQGFGKQDPVAPNTNPDGSDNPTGRAQNRRVEVAIDTCK